MSAKHAALALVLAGAASWPAAVSAQTSGSKGILSRLRGTSQPESSTSPGGAPNPFATAPTNNADAATRDPKVFPASTTLPTPASPDQLKPATVKLPDGPIEPYLLTKDIGPWLVTAQTFRGPDAERFALALVLELRNVHKLPAFILRTQDWPHHSMIRNVPPTAPAGVSKPELSAPEKYRSYDEAVVLVGNEKTQADARKLRDKVKHIKPDCLNGMSHMFLWRKGLSMALVTANPLVPAQNIYSGRRDPLIAQMNEGPRTVLHAPGRYTLEVANYSGRSTFDVERAKFEPLSVLKRSPLATAHDDAMKLANALASTPEIRSTGQQVYVYHDRVSSRVFIGSFNSENDPAAGQLREFLLKNTVPLLDHGGAKNVPARKYGVNRMIAPANQLTDIEPFREAAGVSAGSGQASE